MFDWEYFTKIFLSLIEYHSFCGFYERVMAKSNNLAMRIYLTNTVAPQSQSLLKVARLNRLATFYDNAIKKHIASFFSSKH